MLTQVQVKELFDYDPETGHLIWSANCGAHKVVGKFAGYLHPKGYRVVRIYGKNCYAHRLVWLWHHGAFPINALDHINGLRSDNRIENLREATNAQNTQNRRRANSNNKLGYLGVSLKGNKWQARIRLSGRNLHIGTYNTLEAAHEAYLAKKRELHEFNTL